MTIDEQLQQWVKGNLLHDHDNNRCVPDFSCCNDNLLVDQEIREDFYELFQSGDQDAINYYLKSFLVALAENNNPHARVYVIGLDDH